MIVNVLLFTINLITLEFLNLHLLPGGLVVHLISKITRRFAIRLLLDVVSVQASISALHKLFLGQARELEFAPGGDIIVFLYEEDLKAVIGQLNAVLCTRVIDREWEVDDLNVPDLGHVDFQDVLGRQHVDILA